MSVWSVGFDGHRPCGMICVEYQRAIGARFDKCRLHGRCVVIAAPSAMRGPSFRGYDYSFHGNGSQKYHVQVSEIAGQSSKFNPPIGVVLQATLVIVTVVSSSMQATPVATVCCQ